jgi:hypothetical protein
MRNLFQLGGGQGFHLQAHQWRILLAIRQFGFAVGEQKRTLPVSFVSAAMATILSDRSHGRNPAGSQPGLRPCVTGGFRAKSLQIES